MLYEEEGDEILFSIASKPDVIPEVRQFCLSILELLKQEGLAREGTINSPMITSTSSTDDMMS